MKKPAEPMPVITAEALVAAAVRDKLADIDRRAERLQTQQLLHKGRNFYADLDATRTIEVTMIVYAHLPDTDPVPVPYPLQPGYWLTADFDEGKNRLTVAMNMAEFRDLGKALMERNAAIWGRKQIHRATVETMAAIGATPEEIKAYDVTLGWE